MCTFIYCYIISQQGWQNAGKYEYFPCQWHLPVNTAIYWKILALEITCTSKYWKIEFTTLELKQKATLNIYIWLISIIEVMKAMHLVLVLLSCSTTEKMFQKGSVCFMINITGADKSIAWMPGTSSKLGQASTICSSIPG